MNNHVMSVNLSYLRNQRSPPARGTRGSCSPCHYPAALSEAGFPFRPSLLIDVALAERRAGSTPRSRSHKDGSTHAQRTAGRSPSRQHTSQVQGHVTASQQKAPSPLQTSPHGDSAHKPVLSGAKGEHLEQGPKVPSQTQTHQTVSFHGPKGQ